MASAIVPVYNGSDTLARCLESLRRQGHALKEIIVIDDGSRDGSLDLLRSFAEKDPRFIVVHHEQNQGLARTLNDGIARVTGDAVLIMHQDCELVADDWIDRALGFLRGNPRAVVAGTPVYPFQEMNSVELAFGLLRDTFFVAPVEVERLAFSEFKCDLLPQSVLEVIPFDTRFRISGEDQALSMDIARAGYTILRYQDLRYAQRFGKGASLLHQLRKEATYARTEAGVLLRTSFRVASQSRGSSTSSRRLTNRASSLLVVVAVVLAAILFVLGANGLLYVVTVVLVLPRIGLVVSRWTSFSHSDAVRARSLACALAVMAVADLTYGLALVEGSLAYAVARRV